MTTIYHQTTGQIFQGGALLGTGYAGNGEGLNDPADEAVPNVGPIPRGVYSIGAPITHPAAGPFTMRLTPIEGTNTFSRAGFLIHGDTAARNHTASHGCVVADRGVREAVDADGDRRLEVV